MARYAYIIKKMPNEEAKYRHYISVNHETPPNLIDKKNQNPSQR